MGGDVVYITHRGREVSLPALYHEHPPYHVERGLALYLGNALDVLKTFRDESVHAAITSPPYFGLRDYGTGTWEGGDSDCDHLPSVQPRALRDRTSLTGGTATVDQGTVPASPCPRCGSVRTDQQVGLEQTPEEYIRRLTEIFRELRRALHKDGTFWLNISDSYAGQGKGFRPGAGRADGIVSDMSPRNRNGLGTPPGLKPKDLILIGPLLAASLQADGWYLRAQCIWHKPNAMPSSAKDRPGLDYEYVYQLTKSPRYHFDMDAVKQTAAWERWGKQTVPKHRGSKSSAGWMEERSKEDLQALGGKERNLRTVWSIPTKPYPGAHFAAFPPALVETCIAASTHEGDTVLDPFIGSGTTAYQCATMGRKCVGIDLKKEYLQMTIERFQGTP